MSATTIDPRTRQQALEWLVLVWSREADENQMRELAAWRLADARHESAWQHVSRLDAQLAALPAQASGSALRAMTSAGLSRRSALRALSLFAIGGGAAYGLQASGVIERGLADLKTAKGEQRELVLADGSALRLNTDTAVDLHVGAQERRLRLLRGEIFVDLRGRDSQAQPPFIVETADGRAQATSARFNVRLDAEQARISVFEGSAQIESRSGLQASLQSGEQAAFDAQRIEPVQSANRNALAWTRGLLMAERMRLDQFLAELNRYRPGVIRCDATAARQIISGSYPLADTDRVLSALEHALPLRVRRYSRWWVIVEAIEPTQNEINGRA